MTQDHASDALIEGMRMQADPPADRAIAAIVGAWQAQSGTAVSAAELLAQNRIT